MLTGGTDGFSTGACVGVEEGEFTEGEAVSEAIVNSLDLPGLLGALGGIEENKDGEGYMFALFASYIILPDTPGDTDI